MSNAVLPSTIRGLDVNVTKTPTFSTLVQEAPSGYTTRLAQMQNPIWNFKLIWNYLKDNPQDIPVGYTYTDLQTMMGFWLARQGQLDDFLYDDPSDDSVGPALLTGGAPNTQAELQVVVDTTNPITAATVASGGTGFNNGDWLAVTGGGGSGAIIEVQSNSGGVIATFTIVEGGTGYTTTSGASLVTLTGSGTGSPTANITANSVYYSPVQRNMGGQFWEDITDLNGGIQVYANGVAKSSPTDYTLLGPGLAFAGYSFAGLYLKWVSTPTAPVTAQFNFYFRVRFESDKQEFDEFMNGIRLWCIGGTYATNSQSLSFTTARPPTP